MTNSLEQRGCIHHCRSYCGAVAPNIWSIVLLGRRIDYVDHANKISKTLCFGSQVESNHYFCPRDVSSYDRKRFVRKMLVVICRSAEWLLLTRARSVFLHPSTQTCSLVVGCAGICRSLKLDHADRRFRKMYTLQSRGQVYPGYADPIVAHVGNPRLVFIVEK